MTSADVAPTSGERRGHGSGAPGSRVPLLALLGANAISMTGNVVALVAIPWFVLQTTGSATKTGVTAFAALVPVILSGVFGGTLVDRLGFRRASLAGDIASAAAVAAVPLLHLAGQLSFPLLVALVFVGGLLDAPGSTARAALVPDMAREAGWPVERASGASAVVERASRLIGAPLAGVLVAAAGPTAALWIDAGSFVVSAALVGLFVPRSAPAAQPRQKRSYFGELRAGFGFLRADPTLRAVIGLVACTNFLDSISIWRCPCSPRARTEAPPASAC